ncbi:2-hydroxyacid dehydrogenase [Salmonella enterica subsp. enterica]|nr:2-hydroxyacid dehydrogenase [Salmonella enterica subsp. enterica]
MKPSIILYKTLPDDLLHRLEAHFTVTQVPNLHPETVAATRAGICQRARPSGHQRNR